MNGDDESAGLEALAAIPGPDSPSLHGSKSSGKSMAPTSHFIAEPGIGACSSAPMRS